MTEGKYIGARGRVARATATTIGTLGRIVEVIGEIVVQVTRAFKHYILHKHFERLDSTFKRHGGW